MKAEELIWRAKAWIDENPDTWNYIVTLAKRETRAHRRFSVRWALEEARKRDWATLSGVPFAVNNDFAPFFARRLIEIYPEMASYIVMRSSKLDFVSQEGDVFDGAA